MESIYRDAYPDVFATCDYNYENFKAEIAMRGLEDEAKVQKNVDSDK